MLRNVCFVLACVCSLMEGKCESPKARLGVNRPPNIVLIVSDDQAWTDFGFMGSRVVQTPALDALAARSVLFRRGYVPTSLCRPSLATLITGRYPHQHGITGNDPPKGSDRRRMLGHIRSIGTLPRLLAAAGYRSFQSGKWWEGSFADGGFTAGMTHGDPAHGGRHGDEGLRIGREGLQPVFDFIEGSGARPYFLWYAPMMPHLPHNPPDRLLAKYRAPGRSPLLARYYAMCEWFDETCGDLFAFLDRRGDTKRTLIVFVVDNGWITPAVPKQGERVPPFGPRSKQSPYDGGVRTPIIVSWPARLAPADLKTLVSSIDIAPTILAAAELKKEPAMPGLNLLEIIGAHGASPRSTVFGEIFTHDLAELAHPTRGLRYRWCVDGDWKLIVPHDPRERRELFNVKADPFESTNCIAAHSDLAARLQGELDAWWRPQQ